MKQLFVTLSLAAASAVLFTPVSANATEATDSGTQRDGMHACEPGFAMSGAHLSNNVFLCSDNAGALGAETIDATLYTWEWVYIGQNAQGASQWRFEQILRQTATQRDGMHACPFGEVMTGLQNSNNWLLCAPHGPAPRGKSWFEIEDDGTQRDGMHACPSGTVMTGIQATQNRFLCGGFH